MSEAVIHNQWRWEIEACDICHDLIGDVLVMVREQGPHYTRMCEPCSKWLRRVATPPRYWR